MRVSVVHPPYVEHLLGDEEVLVVHQLLQTVDVLQEPLTLLLLHLLLLILQGPDQLGRQSRLHA